MKLVTREVVFENMLWRFFERCGAQLITFVVTVILARLLEPSTYGTIALITVITNILQIFIDSGLGNALIQKKDADDVDFSSVFYFNMAVCMALYIILFISAPFISGFYEMQELTPFIRVLGITLIISGLKNVQQAYVSRNMLFKRFFFATIGGTVGSAFVGIGAAYAGFGVWALVAQILFNNTVDTIILWKTVKWRPIRVFSLQRLKALVAYGWKLLACSLLDLAGGNLRQLVIGKFYTSDNLAYYNRGNQLPYKAITNINSAINSILFPAIAFIQNDIEAVKAVTRRAIKTTVYCISPLMVGLFVCAEPVIRLLLTEKWIMCVPYLRIFCITYIFYPLYTANLNAYKGIGKSEISLKVTIVIDIVSITILIATAWHSVKAIAYGMLVECLFSQIMYALPNKKLIHYGYLAQLKDIFPYLAISIAMGVAINCINFFAMNDLVRLIIQLFIGGGVYLLLSIIFKIDSFLYIKTFLQSRGDRDGRTEEQ